MPTDAELLAFEAKHPRHRAAKEHAIRVDLGIPVARYYQLLGRLTWTEEALQIDPMTTNRLRRLSMKRQTDRASRS